MVLATAPPAVSLNLGALMDCYQGEIYAYLFRMVRHEADAQDLLQETFLRAWRARTRLAPDSNYRAWLYRIATNAALNHLRRGRRESTGMEEHILTVPDGAGEAEMRHVDLVGAVENALQCLPPKQRAALIGRKFQGLCYEEIAVAIGSTPEAARANVYQALRRIKLALGREDIMDQPCPDWEHRMVAALAGDLDPRAHDELAGHVSWCEECNAAWTVYQQAGDVLDVCCAVPETTTLVRLASPVPRGPDVAARLARRPRVQHAVVETTLLPATPVGPLQLAVTEHGLCRVWFGADGEAFDAALRADGYNPRRGETAMTARVVEQLASYFAGSRKEFDLPLDLGTRSAFDAEVLRATAEVEPGSLATYAGIAARVGRPRAYRAVGNALRRNPVPVVIPCHRVVSTNGLLRGYVGGVGIKRTLLDLEGALAS